MSVRSFSHFAYLRQWLSCLLSIALLPVQVARGQSSSTVVLASAATPGVAEPNVTTVNITGTGFPGGTIAPSSVAVHLTPVSPATGPAMVAVVSSVATLFGNSRRITFQAEPANVAQNIRQPTNYQISVKGASSSGTSFSSSNTAALTINPPASLQSVSPAAAAPGQTLSVTINGVFSNFFQGSTVANFGPGISVGGAAAGSFGPVTVVSATSATAQITLAATTSLGIREVTVSTGSELAALSNGFTVSGTPALTLISPNSGQQGKEVSVALTGQSTHFAKGITTASFGTGVTVSSLTVNSATSATALLNIAASATLGVRSVTLTTGSEVVTLANGFTVTNGTPALTQISPSTGQQGQESLSVALTGQLTHFAQGTTAASFGVGITVSSITVSSATTATAVLKIDGSAAPGARNVTVTTGSEVVTLTNGFTVTTGTPVLTKVSPNAGSQGQPNLQVVLTGQFTHLAQGTTAANFGTGITVVSLTVTSAVSATAVLNIGITAALGARNVTLTTGSEAVTLVNGFSVTNAAPAITQISPNTGRQGQSGLLAEIAGQNTHWAQGTTTFNLGAGVTVVSLTVNSATAATALLSIASNAATGVHSVSATTGTEVATLTNGFSVASGIPTLTGIEPSTGIQGQSNLTVALSGVFTHFVQGTTTGSFGAGITVESLTINSATTATALLKISPTASLGARTVSLVTASEVVTIINGFGVVAGTPILTQVSPKSGQQQNSISLPAGTLTFENPPPGLTPNNFLQGSPVNPSSRLTNQFENLGAIFSTFNGSPYAALVDLTGQAPSGTNGIGAVNAAGNLDYTQDLDIFLVLPGTTTAAVTDFVSIQGDEIPIPGDVIFSAYDIGGNLLASGTQPDSAGGLYSLSAPGIHEFRLHSTSGTVAYDNLSFDAPASPLTLPVTLSGQFTHFVQGKTVATFAAGVNVESLTVHSPTSATAVINVSAAAQLGANAVTVTTGAEVVTLANGFTVIPGNPLLTRVMPNMGTQGQSNVAVVLTGEFTHFVQGTTSAAFGSGITVSSLTVNSATSATAIVNISAAAAGARSVTVTTGNEVVTLPNIFIVTNATALLTEIAPKTGMQGQQNISVSLTGQFTHFTQASTSVSFGPDISVKSLTVNSATNATAVINIDSTAEAGERSVTVTTAAEVVSLSNGFSVTSGVPTLTLLNPSSGQQGQQNLSIALSAVFTNFTEGATTVSFGAGITVTSLTVNSPASATALVDISPSAPAGLHEVSLTTGGETLTLMNGFKITVPTPALTEVSPNLGQQGQQALSVALTGLSTHFVQGTTTVSFGAGVSVVSLTVNSSTSANALINIDSAAALGSTNVVVTTGAFVAEFTVSDFTEISGPNDTEVDAWVKCVN